MDHPITRHRHELRRRALTVTETLRVTPNMVRVLLHGSDMHDFPSLSFDDHVKLFLPQDDGEVARRDYTPRSFDRTAGTLALDFAVHDAGPATRRALEARPGDRIEIGGPRGSAVVSPTFSWWLLAGDETALPAMGRRIEELPAGTHVTSVATVAGPEEEQRFVTAAEHRPIWLHRPPDRADDPAPFLDALETMELPEGDGFVWIAAEAGVARAVRDLFRRRGHPIAWTKAAGYWKHGIADAHDRLDD